MFCPSCGIEERQPSRFCRACGTDLRLVRASLERPDSITTSAVTAREEIGRAVAAQVQSIQDADDLTEVVRNVLPEVEKFLESPAERRLRAIRSGLMLGAVGAGLLTGCVILPIANHLVWTGAFVLLFLGLSNVIGGLFFTQPKGMSLYPANLLSGNEPLDAMASGVPHALPSVTEETTDRLEPAAVAPLRASHAGRKDTH